MKALLALLLCLGLAATGFAGNPSGDLRIELLTAYNFVVDSNVESPSTYAPRATYLAARFINDGANAITNVFTYIGNYNGGAGDTPGSYPSRTHAELTGTFSLTHQGGSAGTDDATRYIGTLDPGEEVTVYWLVSYPNCDSTGNAVFGDIGPSDDLWLQYDIWATGVDAGTPLTADVTRTVYMRNLLSSATSKIYPNGTNSVPDQYKALLSQFMPAWTNATLSGTPGIPLQAAGFWFDIGEVGAGFDNDGNMAPDQNAWLQPIGDPGIFDPSRFRLIRTSAMLIVKLSDGSDLIDTVEDQLYFEQIPGNNNGAVGLAVYEFMPLQANASSVITPYQAAASGYDSEKFNGDFGVAVGNLASGTSVVHMAKSVNLSSAYPGAMLSYAIGYTNRGSVAIGMPAIGMPAVVQESIPTGTYYVAGSATISNTLPAGVTACSVAFSTNNGTTWLWSEPVAASNVTDLQWWLSDALPTGSYGTVKFQVVVRNPFVAPQPLVASIAGIGFGNMPPFVTDDAVTLILGTNTVGDTVWRDDGAGASLGNGSLDAGEPGISNATVYLYFDGDGDGQLDPTDPCINSAVTAANGTYLFSSLPDGKYIVAVATDDPDLPFGFTRSTPVSYAADLDSGGVSTNAVNYLAVDFGFAPVLAFTNQLATAGPFREGGSVSYSIVASNRVSGNGGFATYTIWAATYDTVHSGTGLKAWTSPGNAYDGTGPNGTYAIGPVDKASELIAVNGYSIAPKDGSITKVELQLALSTNGVAFGATDTFTVNLYDNATILWTTSYPPASVKTETLAFNVTAAKAWTWNSFAATNLLSIQCETSGKVQDLGQIWLDQAGFRITTDWIAGSGNPALVLNPAPLYDTYATNRIRYVSATPAPNSTTYNGLQATMAWNNIGPIYPGGVTTVTVNYVVLEPPGNTAALFTNAAGIAGATYGDGNPVAGATNSVVTNALPAGAIGNFVWRDLNTNGVQDGGSEAGIADVAVVLAPPGGVDAGRGPGNPVTNYTDSTGAYLFTGLPATGSYTVTVVTATLPGGSGVNTYDEDNGTSSPNNQTVWLLTYDATDGSDTHLTADFGYTGGSLIDGAIWHDMNRSGTATRDTNEPGLTNVVVRLYLGAGTNGTLVTTTATDTNGYFKFTGAGVTNGTYTILVLPGSGDMTNGTWTASYDTDGTGTLNQVTVALVSGGVARGDSTYYRYNSFNLGDTVFHDWDANKTQDAIDEGIPNVTVYLYHDINRNGIIDAAVDALVAANGTDADGKYLFTGLYSTNYIIKVDQTDPDFPARFTCSADPQGPNDGLSVVTPAATELTHDFGYTPIGNGSIGDTVFVDFNADGIQSGLQEPGISNIAVTLSIDFNSNGAYIALAATNTATAGYYRFANLPAGRYRVAVDAADPDLPDDRFGVSYVPTTATTIDRTLAIDENVLAADFGLGPLGAIGDTIFWDANQNGTQDYNENGIVGVIINLYADADGDGFYDAGLDTFHATTTTTTNGAYLFTGLPKGDYVVAVQLSGVIVGATLMADPSTGGLPCSDPAAASILGYQDGEYGVTINAGTACVGADFGYVPPGIIGDTAWIDVNDNGRLDTNEVGLAYVPVYLYSNGVVVATNFTDSSGSYLFQNQPDNTYVLRIGNTHSNFPSGLLPAYDFDGTNSAHVITNIVVSGGHVTSVNGTATNGVDLAMDFGYRYAGTNVLSGTVGLDDPSTNGVLGAGSSGVATNETPFPGVTVCLSFWVDDGDGVRETGEVRLIGSTATATNGDYAFTGLPAGDADDRYIVSLSSPQDNLLLTTRTGVTPALSVSNAVDSLGNCLSAYQTVVPAAVVTNIDFAFKSRINYDFGDLPQTFATLRESSPVGAGHVVPSTTNLYLGATVDTEANGAPSTAADGDGADEDGITPIEAWQAGATGGVLRVTVGAGSGWLLGFMDLNNDGDLIDSGELVVSNAASVGTVTNRFTLPANTIVSNGITTLYARFRLFDSAPDFPEFAFCGLTGNGEVEDYRWLFGALGNYIWRDTDADGVQDSGEAPLAGIRVFVDANANNRWDSNEVCSATGANGMYNIGGFTPGTHSLCVDTGTLPANVYASYDLDNTTTLHRASVAMTNGQVRTDVDFGYYGMAIGGLAWNDANANGVRSDDTPQYLSNVTVRLYDVATNLIGTTATDTNGNYLFDVTNTGTYHVEFLPVGYQVSPSNQHTVAGSSTTNDSDVATNSPYRTPPIAIAAGDRQIHWDLGVFQSAGASNAIGDYVWFDANANGVQDGGESNMQGVTVQLYNSSTTLVASAVTDIQGKYSFAALAAGNYYVKFVAPANCDYTARDAGGNDATDSDAATNGFTAAIVVSNGVFNYTIDCGLVTIIDLAVNTSVSDANPDQGQTIWYTILVTNRGPQNASGVTFTDTWPTSITYVSHFTAKGSYTNTTKVWTLGSVANGESATLVITGTVASANGGLPVTNTMALTTVAEPDSIATNNTASVALTVKTIDLAVSKSVNNNHPYETSNVVYTISVTNRGPGNATGVQLYEPLVSGLSYVTSTATYGIYSNATKIWYVGSLPNGSNATLNLTAQVQTGTGGKWLNNEVVITNLVQTDTVSTNNYASTNINVVGADIAITKTVSDSAPETNATVIYTIQASNLGPDNATGVQVAEPLTNNITYLGHWASQGTYTGTNLWNIGSLAAGASAYLYITSTVSAGTGTIAYIVNVSRVTASSLPDPNPSNNQGNATVGISDLKIAVSSSASNTVLYPGSNITYTIVVTNIGLPPQPSIVVTDAVPAGVSYVASSAYYTHPITVSNTYYDTFNSQAFTNNYGSLTWASNWAEIGEVDGALAGSVQVRTTGDLSIEKANFGVSRPFNASGFRWGTIAIATKRFGLEAGDYVAVEVSNAGGGPWTEIGRVEGVSGTATDDDSVFVVTNMTIPSSNLTATSQVRLFSYGMAVNELVYFDYVRVDLSKRVYTNSIAGSPPVLCSSGYLYEDEYMVFTWQATVATPALYGTITNRTSVTSGEVFFPRYATVTDCVARADIQVTKGVGSNTVYKSYTVSGTREELFVYRIGVTNLGPHTAYGLYVTDLLPAAVTHSNTITLTKGTYNRSSGVWNIGQLNSNTGALMELLVIANTNNPPSTYITNTAYVSALDIYDPVKTNNTNSVVVRTTLAMIAGVRCYRADDRTVVEWATGSEKNTAGFHLYRCGPAGETRLTPRLVPGRLTHHQGGIYRLALPPESAPGPDDEPITYRLEEIECSGARIDHGLHTLAAEATPSDFTWDGFGALPNPDGTPSALLFLRTTHPAPADQLARFLAAQAEQPAAVPVTAPIRPRGFGGTLDSTPAGTVKLNIGTAGVYYVSTAVLADRFGCTQEGLNQALSNATLRLSCAGETVAYRPVSTGLFFYAGQPGSVFRSSDLYLLTPGTGVQFQAAAASNATPAADTLTFLETAHLAELVTPRLDLFRDPRTNFWTGHSLATYGTTNHTAVLSTDGAAGSGTATLVARLYGYFAANHNHARVYVNNTLVSDNTWVGNSPAVFTNTFSQAILTNGANIIRVEAIYDPRDALYAYFYIDTIDILYARHYAARSNALQFAMDGRTCVSVTGFVDSAVTVLDLANPRRPAPLAAVAVDAYGGAWRATVAPSSTAGPFLATRYADALAPVSVFKDTASDLRATTNAARHLTIAASSLVPGAQALATHRRGQNMTARVVDLQDVYDEFNHGHADPLAIRDFLACAHTNWAEPPDYVVLAGAGSYDYRGFTGLELCLLPPPLIVLPDELGASDMPLADADGDLIPDVAIGRLPVLTSTELSNLVSKIAAYEAGGDWKQRVSIVADNNDTPTDTVGLGGDFTASAEQLRLSITNNFTVDRIYLAQTNFAGARAKLLANMNAGAALVSYVGHSTDWQMEKDGLLRDTDAYTLTNGLHAPFIMAMTCLLGRFGDPWNCLAESMVARTNAGTVAAWSPTYEAKHASSMVLGGAFHAAIFDRGHARLGNAMLAAQRETALVGAAPTDLILTYSLMGDPATRLGNDADADEITDWAETAIHGTNPNQADTDADGLADGAEIATYQTGPTDADSDNDGLSDGLEVNLHTTNPLDADTDGDGISDGAEIAGGGNPLVIGDSTRRGRWLGDFRLGGSSDDFAAAILPQAAGSRFVAGSSRSAIGGDKTQDTRGDIDFWGVLVNADGSKAWDRRFGGSGMDRCAAACQAGSGFLLAGLSYSDAGGDCTETVRGRSDFWAVRIDSAGNKVWDRRFGGSDFDFGNAACTNAQGGYLLAGDSLSGAGGDRTESSRGSYDFWAVCLDTNGNKVWDRRFGGGAGDFCNAVCLLPDGGYMLGGESASGAGGDRTDASRGETDVWLVRLDANGNKIWDRRFGGSGYDACYALLPTASGVLVAGLSDSPAGGDKSQDGRGGSDMWVIAIDTNANKFWDARYGGPANDGCIALAATRDGGYILAGYSESNAGGDKHEAGRGGRDYWLVKINAAGILRWDKRFGGSADDIAFALARNPDGAYTVAGYSASPVGGDLVATARGGQDIWGLTFWDRSRGPVWWYSRGVLDETATGNDHAAINTGQFKWMARQAWHAVTNVYGTTAPQAATYSNMVFGSTFTATNNYVTVNAGQAKRVATSLYDWLVTVNAATNVPWTSATNDDINYAPLNIGQTKRIFDFDAE